MIWKRRKVEDDDLGENVSLLCRNVLKKEI